MTLTRITMQGLLKTLALILLFSSLSVRAADGDGADISIKPTGLTIIPVLSEQFQAMNVRIMDPSDILTLNTRSAGDAVEWVPGVGALDGLYRFDVVIIRDTAADESSEDDVGGESLKRHSGTFNVIDGEIIAPQELDQETGKHGFWHGVGGAVMQFAMAITDMIVPEAYAVNLSIDDFQPELTWNDTDAGDDFRVFSNHQAPQGSIWRLFKGGNTEIIDIQANEATYAANLEKSLVIDESGDIHFADDGMFFDRSSQELGIGTTTPAWSIDIHHSSPQIRLYDEDDDTYGQIQYSSGFLTFEGNSEQDIFEIDGTAPEGSLILDDLGVLHASFSGSNTAGDGLRNVMALKADNTALAFSSDVGFALRNDREGFQYNFRTGEGAQSFIATKQGTGGPELELKNTTNNYLNATLHVGRAFTNILGQWVDGSSRDYKENIVYLQAEEALETLQGLSPVKFNIKRDAEKEINPGFIAEDVPNLVATKNRKGLSALELTAILTKVLQEQQKTISELSEKVEKLEQELTLMNNG